jgi:hypothetical protein
MSDDITYVIPDGIEFHLHMACETCRYWDAEMAIDGWATCYQLVHGKGWKMDTPEQVPPGDASIVKTRKAFWCKYWEGK